MSAEKSNAAVEKTANASEPAITASAPVHKSTIARLCDEYLVFPKLLYFGLNVVIYSTHAFLNQFVKRVWGISDSDYALTNFVQFTNIFGSYVFSRLADRTGAYRSIVAFCVAAYCACTCMLMFPLFKYNDNRFLVLVQYLIINGLAFFFTSGTFPLLDSMVMSQLSSNPSFSKEMFGRQRLWGTIGHCVIGEIVHMLEHASFVENLLGKENVHYLMFIILIITSVMFIGLVYLGIPKDLKIEAHSHGHHGHHGGAAKEASPAGPKPSAATLLLNPSFAFFLLTVLVAGLVRAVITTYQSPYITNELHFDKGVVSKSIFVRVFPEVTLYFFSKELFQHCGIYWVLLMGHIAGVIRMFGYTLITGNQEAVPADNFKSITKANLKNYYVIRDKNGDISKAWLLAKPSAYVKYFIYLLEFFKGANSSLTISSAARIASDMAPKGLASTAQGYVSGTWQGLSMTLGSAMCLFTVQHLMISGTFYWVSIVGAVCVFLIALKFALIDRTIFTRSTKTIA